MTKVAQHTPGPWTLIPASPYDGDDDDLLGAFVSPASIEGADGNPVCQFGSEAGSGTLFENEADYHLICSAPELLRALQDIIDSCVVIPPNHMPAAVTKARAAIAKATGAS